MDYSSVLMKISIAEIESMVLKVVGENYWIKNISRALPTSIKTSSTDNTEEAETPDIVVSVEPFTKDLRPITINFCHGKVLTSDIDKRQRLALNQEFYNLCCEKSEEIRRVSAQADEMIDKFSSEVLGDVQKDMEKLQNFLSAAKAALQEAKYSCIDDCKEVVKVIKSYGLIHKNSIQKAKETYGPISSNHAAFYQPAKREQEFDILSGHLYFADLNPVPQDGFEVGGVRPVLVIGSTRDAQNFIVLPCSSKSYNGMSLAGIDSATLANLKDDTYVMVDRERQICRARFIRYVGPITDERYSIILQKHEYNRMIAQQVVELQATVKIIEKEPAFNLIIEDEDKQTSDYPTQVLAAAPSQEETTPKRRGRPPKKIIEDNQDEMIKDTATLVNKDTVSADKKEEKPLPQVSEPEFVPVRENINLDDIKDEIVLPTEEELLELCAAEIETYKKENYRYTGSKDNKYNLQYEYSTGQDRNDNKLLFISFNTKNQDSSRKIFLTQFTFDKFTAKITRGTKKLANYEFLTKYQKFMIEKNPDYFYALAQFTLLTFCLKYKKDKMTMSSEEQDKYAEELAEDYQLALANLGLKYHGDTVAVIKNGYTFNPSMVENLNAEKPDDENPKE